MSDICVRCYPFDSKYPYVIREGGAAVYRKGIKRILDLVMAALLTVILSPLMLITAVLVKLSSPGPVIFRQERIGLNGKTFTILKFRTMKNNSEHTGSGVYSGKGDARVTGLGRVLRATSVDELPQLLNIIAGQMSFIGPRPPLTYHPWTIDKYTEQQFRMFEARPGITGWAQVHGRKCVEWNERIRMNVWYVDHISFWLDAKIFFMTIFKLFTNADNKNVGATVGVPQNNPEI